MKAAPPEDRAHIAALLRQEPNASLVAAETGYSASFVRKVAVEAGISLIRPGRPTGSTDRYAEALAQEAVRLRLEKRLTAAEIGELIDRSDRTVRGYLRDLDEP